jgi:hypothetical protein
VADRYAIAVGESVTLSWDVTGAKRVQIMPGFEGGIGPTGSLTVQPPGTVSYLLHACYDDKCSDQTLMIITKAAQPTPTPTWSIPPTPTLTPSPTPRPFLVRRILDRLADVWPQSCPP